MHKLADKLGDVLKLKEHAQSGLTPIERQLPNRTRAKDQDKSSGAREKVSALLGEVVEVLPNIYGWLRQLLDLFAPPFVHLWRHSAQDFMILHSGVQRVNLGVRFVFV